MSTEIRLTCDRQRLGGSSCGRPVQGNIATTFAFADCQYEAHLCRSCRTDLLAALGDFIQISQLMRRGQYKYGRLQRRTASGHVFTTADVRAWLRRQGLQIPDNGRLLESEIGDYARAHGGLADG